MNGNYINGKLIVVGDTHFGIRRFSIDTLRDQLSLFNKQIFPYMEKNKISTIFQLGDLFDNRTTTDINFIHVLKEEFFEKIKSKNIILHALVGNHDIYYRESREVTLVKFFRDLYPENFILYENRTYIDINGNKTYIVPWITKDEDLTFNEISECHNILGHFEIRHFALVKGHMSTDAKLTSDFFTTNTKVKNVFSGHYHIKDTKGLVKYLGTPWQNNYSDYEEEKGFYVWDEDDYLEFHENKSSKKYIKVKYNDEKDNERFIEISGLFKKSRVYTQEEYNLILPELKQHEIKVFINKAKDRSYEEMLYSMKEAGIANTLINNEELTEIIGTDYIEKDDDDHTDTRTLITDTIKSNREDLLPLLLEMFNEIDRTILKEV